jgi:hypothetical protein
MLMRHEETKGKKEKKIAVKCRCEDCNKQRKGHNLWFLAAAQFLCSSQ